MPSEDNLLREASKLVEILEMHAAPIQSAIAAFSQCFSTERHAIGVSLLRNFLDAAHSSPSFLDMLPRVLIVYFLLRHVGQEARRSGSGVAAAVRAAQYHELQRLEGLLREDAKTSESLKFKQNAPTGAKKQTAKDASEIDVGRAHLLLKAVIFRQLLDKPLAVDASVSDLFKVDKNELEAEADSWATPPAKLLLVDLISELKSAADAEMASALGGAANRSIPLPDVNIDDCRSGSVMQWLDGPRSIVTPPVQRLQPTFPALSPHEFRIITASSDSSAFCLDTQGPSNEWKTVTGLLTAARTTTLSAAQHHALTTATPQIIVHAGLTVQAFLEISEKNPQTAAQLIQSVQPTDAYLDAIIGLPGAAGCQRTEILLACRKVIQPYQLSAYVRNMISAIRANANQKPAQLELVSNFAVTLHQLVGGPDGLRKADAEPVVPVLSEFATAVPDVASLWSSLLKT